VSHDEAIRIHGGTVKVVKSQDVKSLTLDDSARAENGAEKRCALPGSRNLPCGAEKVQESRIRAKGSVRSGDDTSAPLLSDLIGHDEVIACLRTSLRAARELGKPLAPTLFSGPPGVGKTALSHAVARELGVRLHKLHGSALRDPGFLAGWLAQGGRHDLFFVDEIHAVPRDLCEMLYEAIDRRRLTLPVIQGIEGKTITIELEPYLLRAGWIDVTPLGRVAARAG